MNFSILGITIFLQFKSKKDEEKSFRQDSLASRSERIRCETISPASHFIYKVEALRSRWHFSKGGAIDFL
jgi:hypothetical protein